MLTMLHMKQQKPPVAMSSADLDQAELELGYTIVRSPISRAYQ